MKMSLNFLRIVLAAAGLMALVAPASAQVVGGSNCSTIREMDKRVQCLTRPTDGIQDKEGDQKRDGARVKYENIQPSTATGVPMPGPHAKYDEFKPGTATGIPMPGPHVQYGTIGTRSGTGGSGGKRSAN